MKMSAIQTLGLVLATLLLGYGQFSHAEDTDLFLGIPTSAADAPNVLFVIDNTANWSQTGPDGRPAWTSEAEALAEIFRNLEEDVVNVGFMFYTETGGGNSNTDGAYVRSAIRFMDSATKELYAQQIEGFDINDDKSNGGKAGLAMAEAYLYFTADSPEAGNDKNKTDYLNNPDGVISAGNITVTDGVLCGYKGNGDPKSCSVYSPGGITADGAVWALPGNALTSKSGDPYVSPLPANFCGKNYIIYMSNGAAQDNTSDIRRGEEILSGLGGDTTQIAITPSGSAKNPSDEWARFMASDDAATNVTVFTIDINKVTTGQGPGWTALLKSMADESGGNYYDVGSDVADISGAVNDALSRILSVNSVFASVALPASANTQSTFINQVFIGLFRPDADANPRWPGNLKQYKLGLDNSNDLRVLDVNNNAIIDGGTGFITACARSIWTPSPTLTSSDSYWSFLTEGDRLGDCIAQDPNNVSNFPDGSVVEKAGQAYVTRQLTPGTTNSATGARKVLTCTATGASCATTLTNFQDNNSAITEAALVADDADDRTAVINWARGLDNLDENDNSNETEMRPSVHGDVIHSEPVAIDYASDPNSPQVVVFYGANDGMLRAINGSRDSAHNSANAGAEFWTFVPPSIYPMLKKNRDNDVPVNFPASGTSAATSGQQKPYGADGPLTAFVGDYGAGDKRYLYAGLRRAGRTVYAMDVTSINSPALLWRQGCPNLDNDTGCTSTDWEDIGQTWSPMMVAEIEGRSNPVILMGGGYDNCEDFDNNSTMNNDCVAADKGDVIFVLDAVTGAILQKLPTDRAVVGEVRIVNVSDALLAPKEIQFAYAADMGGNVYRISGADANTAIGTTLPSNTTGAGWTITKIASLGCDTTATCLGNRKFIFGPDVVRIPKTDKLAILIGSGDREKPLADYGAAAAVQNYFFSLTDQPTNATWFDDPSPAVCGTDLVCLSTLTPVTSSGPVVADTPIADQGWRMAMRSGEQVVSGALVVSNTANFSTHIPVQPDAAACETDLGTATTYNVGYDDGEGDLIPITGGGLVPTPVAGKVVLDDGSIVPFCIGCGGEGSAIGGSKVTSGIDWTQPKSRVYWNIVR
ncbi:MAG: hypothetical protein ABJ013_16750 [Halioglobus sp.]